MRISDWSSDVCSSDLEAIAALRNAATDYFEAKPQRAVTLDEFKGAVVPKGTSAETIAILEKHGIAVEVHNKTEGAREKAIQKQNGRASCRERVCQSV